MMHRAWHTAARSLYRNRRRNLATAVAIALGYAAMVLLGGYAIRVERFIRANTVYLQRVGHLVVYPTGGLEGALAQPAKYALSPEAQQIALDELGKLTEVEFVTRQLKGMGLAGNGCKTLPFSALGVEPELDARVLQHPEVLSATPELGRPLAGKGLSEYPGVDGATGLSAGLFRLLGKKKVHDELDGSKAVVVPDCGSPGLKQALAADANVQLAGLRWAGGLSAVDAEVVQVFHTPLSQTEDGTVLTTLATLQRLYDTDSVTSLAVFLRDSRDTQALASRVRSRLAARGLSVDVYPFDDERVGPYYAGTIPLLVSLVGFIGLLVVSVVVLSVLNAMTLSVLERTREMGTLRALGFTRRQLLGLFLREAMLLSVLAVGAGLIVGVAVALGVNAANIRFSPPGMPGTIQLVLTPTPLLCAAIALVLVPMSAVGTWLAVRRRVGEPVVSLLSSSAA
jgi:putative ABC transport system permease protein